MATEQSTGARTARMAVGSSAEASGSVPEPSAPDPSPELMPVVSTANHPPGFDAAAVSTATAAQLKFWIDKANAAAGRKVLTKVGRVNDLRRKLAAHYGLDLSMPIVSNVPAAVGPASTLDIQNRQWDYLRDLGNEWVECATMGKPFLLCQPSSAQNDSLRLLSEAVASLDVAPSSFPTPLAFAPTTLTPIPTNDTIQALRVAAHAGDRDACALLRHLYRMLVPEGSPSDPTAATAATTSWSPSACTVATSDPGTMTPTVPAALPLVTAPAQPASEDQAILQACQAEFGALSRASSLCEVIGQVEEGRVQQIRDKYGPCKGCRPHPLWGNVKVTVNRRERLYAQLMNEFAGDKVHFFDFFTRQPQDESGSSKGKRKASSESLFALCKVVEAILRWDEDLRGEAERLQFCPHPSVVSKSTVFQRGDRLGTTDYWKCDHQPLEAEPLAIIAIVVHHALMVVIGRVELRPATPCSKHTWSPALVVKVMLAPTSAEGSHQ
ncbi:hypothetical protein BDN67DRAFT_1004905 [Paxillus ammoniavirescens]|nr:hypothetical protein BDN67DRAFT_1004905 [Paxillus ammoniavirescens]